MPPQGKFFKIRHSETTSEVMFRPNAPRISPPIVSAASEAI